MLLIYSYNLSTLEYCKFNVKSIEKGGQGGDLKTFIILTDFFICNCIRKNNYEKTTYYVYNPTYYDK